MAWFLIVLYVAFLFSGLASFFVPIVKSKQTSVDVLTKGNWALFWSLLVLSMICAVLYSFVD
jgi:hypothetical protein